MPQSVENYHKHIANGIEFNFPVIVKAKNAIEGKRLFIKGLAKGIFKFIIQMDLMESETEAVKNHLLSINNYTDQGTIFSINKIRTLQHPLSGIYCLTSYEHIESRKINYEWNIIIKIKYRDIYLRFFSKKDISNTINNIIKMIYVE